MIQGNRSSKLVEIKILVLIIKSLICHGLRYRDLFKNIMNFFVKLIFTTHVYIFNLLLHTGPKLQHLFQWA